MTKKMTKKYKPRKPFNYFKLTSKEAQVIGNELERIRNDNGGVLTPQLVVDEASTNDSPLNRFFEWDDSKASNLWRLHLARVLITSVEVEVTYKGRKRNVKAFFNVNVPTFENQSVEKSVYVDVASVTENEALRKQVVQEGFRALLSWKREYEKYREFFKVVKAIKEVKSLIKRKAK